MSDNDVVGRQARRLTRLGLGLLTAAMAYAAGPALADGCPGHPDALGTSRTLVVDPREHPRIGTMQYGETLPLQDGEVVLTFDDGPLPRYTNQVLEILAAECVKATFFVVGRMAQAYPDGVRRMRDGGHSIGTHSQSHPLSFHRMTLEQAKQEVDAGIASTAAALGDATALSPFFRIPGLLRAEAVESYLTDQGLQAWSADFPADDWRHISSAQVFQIAMTRLEAKGKGIVLLHDIQPRTVGALPGFLRELKARGYRVVHVVQATPERPKTATEPGQWRLHPVSESVAISRWPAVPSFVYADTSALPAPAFSDSDLHQGQLVLASAVKSRRMARGEVPLPQSAPWPRQWSQLSPDASSTLPVPARNVFQIPEKTHASIDAMLPLTRHADASANARAELDPAVRQIMLDGGGLRRRLFAPVAQISSTRNTVTAR
jgi:peptidoglycan/xylan/chitin deacetylase (PgdA/CDA1 family)